MNKIKKFSTYIGTLTTVASPIVVLSCGDDQEQKKVTFDFKADLEKVIPTITSTKDKATLYAHVKAKQVGHKITAKELGIAMPTFSGGVKVSHTVATIYDQNSGAIVVTTTLVKGETKVTKDITITAKVTKTPFAFTDDLAKIASTASSSKIAATLLTDIGTKEIDAVVTATELGLTEQAFSDGVTATYAVKTKYNEETEVIVVTATLAKTDETSVAKIITINAKESFNFASDLRKIGDVTSTKISSTLNTAVGSKNVGEVVINMEKIFLHFRLHKH